MDAKVKSGAAATRSEEEKGTIKKGPWTPEEDTILVNYIASHGEGRWNSAARSAGLKRTGKSCRLRWLNYLRPDVRRGNITLHEQLLILHLHSRWGNRWSKIAQHLPGRTDNEIKNYWRTRVVKQAKQLKCDVNSKQFRDAMRYVWMPRLLERIRATSDCCPTQSMPNTELHPTGLLQEYVSGTEWVCPNYTLSESSVELQVASNSEHSESSELVGIENGPDLISLNNEMFEEENINGGVESLESLWNDENIWFLREQLCDDLQMKDQ